MRKILGIVCILLSLTACKKDKQEQKADANTPVPIQALADRSMQNKSDWTRDLQIYIDDVLACTNNSQVQIKYVFHADAFETPPVALFLLKGEDDKVYGCSFEGSDTVPHYAEVKIKPSPDAPRFYPGELPKADSCLTNTRILDKTGHTAGWLAQITC